MGISLLQFSKSYKKSQCTVKGIHEIKSYNISTEFEIAPGQTINIKLNNSVLAFLEFRKALDFVLDRSGRRERERENDRKRKEKKEEERYLEML